ncbi:hypothetical protein F4680DRAFT_392237 [Xylaria scruposa]|nr:hypothetical protein F4680DRAFT_392237 [Xylaria scruposa]
MDHIEEDFFISKDIDVENVTDPDKHSPPSNLMAFHNFPRDRGWALSQDYTIGTFNNADSAQSTSVEKELGPFLQAWLFFGLAFTIIQQEGRPILSYDELLRPGDRKYVSTEKLKGALEKWKKWELNNPNGIRLRMIRVENILDIGRRVTRKNCSYDGNARPLAGTPLFISDTLALSLMVLGEALSAMKAQILKLTHSELRGWHRDDGEGWGQPQYVWSRMRRENWCPRTIYLWKNQFRSHPTLLLASYHAYHATDRFKGKNHTSGADGQPKCDNNNCVVKPVDRLGQYQSAHAGDCINGDCGEMQGPDMSTVSSILRKIPAQIPLLQFREDPTREGLTNSNLIDLAVISPQNGTKYATISHVWSDGFGNENKNALYPCQLRFIWRQLRALGDPSLPFWMDTLVIPVEDMYKDTRNIAINQIFEVFRDSSSTIVLDEGLINLPPGREERPAHAAMRILASSWMRRLWTLQEAFLSKRIHFSFQEGQQSSMHLREFGDISGRLGKKGSALEFTSALLNMVNEHLRQHIIDDERGLRERYLKQGKKGLDEKQAAVLIANVWRAAKWRTTTNPYHETLALATLLNLDYQNSEIGTAGLEKTSIIEEIGTNEILRRSGRRDELMVQFWTQFNDRWPNSIPPGIIFLPGDRINKRGFGWAPRTWMSADPVDGPDPLSIINSTAKLNVLDGLRVSYPGFILESKNKRLLLGTDQQDKRFWFPTGPSFLDWYVVEPADDMASLSSLQRLIDDSEPLAIILSRLKPGVASAEIGLLVRIRKVVEPKILTASSTAALENGIESDEHDLGDDTNQRVFYCEILRRVKISRETQPKFHAVNRGRFFEDYKPSDDANEIPEIMVDPKMDDEICVAEELDGSQVWYVDSYFPDREQTDSSTEPNTVAPQTNTLSNLLRIVIGKRRRQAVTQRVGTVVEQPSGSNVESHQPPRRSKSWWSMK